MKANEYKLLSRCIEDGIQLGINRAYKHSDGMPSKDVMLDQIEAAVMQEICEWFDFGDSDE